MLAFIVIGVLFWWLGRSTRNELIELPVVPVEAEAAD